MSIKKCHSLLLLMIHRGGFEAFDFDGQRDVGYLVTTYISGVADDA